MLATHAELAALYKSEPGLFELQSSDINGSAYGITFNTFNDQRFVVWEKGDPVGSYGTMSAARRVMIKLRQNEKDHASPL